MGLRLGGRIAIDTPNVDYLSIHSSFNGGFNLGARIVPGLYGEFMWNRQSTTLSAHDAASNMMTTLTNNAHLDMYQGSLLYEIPTRSQFVPFAVGGIGFTHFDSHGILSFDNRFSYNIGGGVKYLLHSADRPALGIALVALAHNHSEHCLLRPFSGLLYHSH